MSELPERLSYSEYAGTLSLMALLGAFAREQDPPHRQQVSRANPELAPSLRSTVACCYRLTCVSVRIISKSKAILLSKSVHVNSRPAKLEPRTAVEPESYKTRSLRAAMLEKDPILGGIGLSYVPCGAVTRRLSKWG